MATRLVSVLSLVAAIAVAGTPVDMANAESGARGSYHLRLQVPVQCTVEHHSAIAPFGDGYTLGRLHEFCNDPAGYSLIVSYAPGSMKGAVLAVGNERVTLDGSGRAVVSRSAGPRVRDRDIYARPGIDGFDTDLLSFEIQAG